MGKSTSETSSDTDMHQQTTLAPATDEELQLRQLFEQLGQKQAGIFDQLNSIASGSPYALDPASQQELATMQSNDQNQMNIQNKQYADYLGGSRGLRMSDTPISSQAMQMQSLGQSDLLAKYAGLRLQAGLQGNQAKMGWGLGLMGAMPSAAMLPYGSLMGERFATGDTHQWGHGQSVSAHTDSIMNQILQGTQAYNQMGQGTKAFADAAGGFAGM